MVNSRQVGNAIEILFSAGFSSVTQRQDNYSVTITDKGRATIFTDYTTIIVTGNIRDVIQSVEAITELL